jgi:SSS family solute:Na+ symporter
MFDLGVIAAYFLVIIFIGYHSMKKIRNFSDYAVAGRGIPLALLFASMAATATGGGATIGRVAYAYHTGMVILVAAMGFVLNQVLTGLFIAPRMSEQRGVYTVGDMMGYHYGRAGRLLTSVFTFIYCISFYGVQVLAMGRILEAVTGWPLIPMTIVASIAVVAYTWAGGMWAVIFTDALQFIVLAFGITTTTWIALNHLGGVEGLVSRLDPGHLSITGGWSPGELLAFFLAFLLGEAVAPFYVQRYLTARTPAVSKWGVTLFGVYYGFYTIVITVIGLAGVILLPHIDPDLVLASFVRDFLPVGLVGLVFGSMLAAVMSTGDSVLNTSAVIFTRDVYQSFFNPAASDKTLLKWSKATTMIVGLGGVLASLLVPRVLDLLIYTYYLWAPSILPPLVVALLLGKTLERKVSPYAGPPAIVVGMLTTILWGSRFLGEPGGIPSLAAGVLANLITLGVVQILTTRKTPVGSFIPEGMEK